MVGMDYSMPPGIPSSRALRIGPSALAQVMWPHNRAAYKSGGPRLHQRCSLSQDVLQPLALHRGLHSAALRSRAAGSSASGAENGEGSNSGDSSIQLPMPRRSRMVTFTCNKCDGSTSRMVNPIAWDKGLVFVQCGQCKAWHKIQDAAGLIDEIRYTDEKEEKSSSSDAETS